MERAARERLRELILRLRDGDRGALRPLFDSSWPLVLAFSKKMLAGADAEDAAQNAVAKIFAKVMEYDGARDPVPWMLAITAFECRTMRQKVKRRREVGGEDVDAQVERLANDGASSGAWLDGGGAGDGDASAEAALITRELIVAARAVLGAMAPADEEAIRAMMEEVARPAIGAATFRKRLERALGRLRAAWRGKHELF